MKNFSFMHKMHFFVIGLKDGRLVLRNLQDNFGSSPAVFWFRKWVDSGQGGTVIRGGVFYT